MHIRKFITSIVKKVSNGLRVSTEKIVSSIIEAARTISYVETVSNKADTLHRHIKQNSEKDLKKTFEKGTDEAFTYVVLSIVDPRPLPLMALPYKQGDDLTALVKDLLNYTRSLPITIKVVLFDRGFYIGDLISYLTTEKIRYLIFVPQNEAMKKFIAQTDEIASFNHEMNYNKRKSWWKTQTKIVVIKSKYFNKKKNKLIDWYWCFATNLRQSLYLISKYKQRWQIETDFRVHDEARIKTKSNIPIIRYFYFLTSLVLLANWEVSRLLHPTVCFKKYLKFVQKEFEKEVT